VILSIEVPRSRCQRRRSRERQRGGGYPSLKTTTGSSSVVASSPGRIPAENMLWCILSFRNPSGAQFTKSTALGLQSVTPSLYQKVPVRRTVQSRHKLSPETIHGLFTRAAASISASCTGDNPHLLAIAELVWTNRSQAR